MNEKVKNLPNDNSSTKLAPIISGTKCDRDKQIPRAERWGHKDLLLLTKRAPNGSEMAKIKGISTREPYLLMEVPLLTSPPTWKVYLFITLHHFYTSVGKAEHF